MPTLGVKLGLGGVSSKIVNPATLGNIITHVDALDSTKTITNGDEISAITALSGLDWAEVDPDDHATWKPDQLNSKGGIELRDLTQLLYTGFSTSSTHTIIATFEHPSTIGSGSFLFFANSTGGTDNQAKITFSGGTWFYSNNSGGTSSVISDTQIGGEISTGIFQFTNADELIVRWYNEHGSLTSTYTINPADDFNGWDSILIGARTAGGENGAYPGLRFGALVHYSDTKTNSEISGIARYYASRYNLDPTFAYISTETDITSGSPFSFSTDSNFNEDDGAFIIRVQNPATFVDNHYLAVAHDGSSSNTIGWRMMSGANTRGYIRKAGSSLNAQVNTDKNIESNTSVYILKWSNTGSTQLADKKIDTEAHAALADGMTTVNVGSRNGGGDAKDLTVYKLISVRGDKTLKYVNSQAYTSNDFVVAGAGQSLIRGHFSSQADSSDGGDIEFRTNMGNSIGSNAVVFVDGSTGGSAAAKTTNAVDYWWDNALDSVGTSLTNFYSIVDALGYTPNYVLWGQGEDDSHSIDIDTTAEEYKSATLSALTNMRETYGNLIVYIQPIGRRATFGNTGGVQAVREKQQELADENSWINLCPETYDQGLNDDVHLDNAGYVTVSTRNSNKMLSDAGYSVTGSVNGPTGATAVRSGTTVTVTITHDVGTGFTPTSGIEGFVFHDDGVAITINSATGDGVETITLTLASEPSGVEELYYGYDALLGINTANIVRDNSATALPLRAFKITL